MLVHSMSRAGASFFPFPSSEEKTAKAAVQQAPDESQMAQTPDGTQLPPGHPSPSTSQSSGSKCPFLAAQLNQTGSSVFRKASLELQEDVQEMHAVRKGNRDDSRGKSEAVLGVHGPLQSMFELLPGQVVIM